MSGLPHGAVDREEAQARGRYGVELAIGVGHELVGLLGRGVEGNRPVHAVPLREGHLLVAAVNGGGAGVDQVLHGVSPAALQHVEEADQVGVNIGARVLDGVAHPGLGGEVHDDRGAELLEHGLQGAEVGDVGPHEGEPAAREALRVGPAPARHLGEHPQAVELDARVVVGVQVVQGHDARALPEEPPAQECAYESGGAGNENSTIHTSPFLNAS